MLLIFEVKSVDFRLTILKIIVILMKLLHVIVTGMLDRGLSLSIQLLWHPLSHRLAPDNFLRNNQIVTDNRIYNYSLAMLPLLPLNRHMLHPEIAVPIALTAVGAPLLHLNFMFAGLLAHYIWVILVFLEDHFLDYQTVTSVSP